MYRDYIQYKYTHILIQCVLYVLRNFISAVPLLDINAYMYVQTVCVRARLHMIFRNRSQKGHATIKTNGNIRVHQLQCSHTARSMPSNVYMLSMLSAFKKMMCSALTTINRSSKLGPQADSALKSYDLHSKHHMVLCSATYLQQKSMYPFSHNSMVCTSNLSIQ